MPADVQLILVRHAIAEEPGRDWPDDDQRPLSRDGTRKWKQGAAGLATLVPTVDVLLSSPLLRACQTAAIFAKALANPPRLGIVEELAPASRTADTLAALKACPVAGVTVVVGHEPVLAQLAAKLLHLEGPIAFKKGAALAITTTGFGERGPARLDWYATPAMLRALRP